MEPPYKFPFNAKLFSYSSNELVAWKLTANLVLLIKKLRIKIKSSAVSAFCLKNYRSIAMVDFKLFYFWMKMFFVAFLFFSTLYFDLCVFSVSGYPKQDYFLYDIFLSIFIQILFLTLIIDCFLQRFCEDFFGKALYYYCTLFFMTMLYFSSFLIFSDALNFTNRTDKISGTEASFFAICKCMAIAEPASRNR